MAGKVENAGRDVYMAVDSGKFATKVAVLSQDRNSIKNFKFRTKTGVGSLDDDMLAGATFAVRIGDSDNTYMIGNGAPNPAPMATSKMSPAHQLCVWSAIAIAAHDGDRVYPAINMPFDECSIVDMRNTFSEYMKRGIVCDKEAMPNIEEIRHSLDKDGELDITIKPNASKPSERKHITICRPLICPESAGAVYLDVVEYHDKTVGVIDIGNKNTNNTCWQNLEPEPGYCYTTEQGGNLLISGLAQALTAKFSARVDELQVAKVLMQPADRRMLVPNNGDKAVEEESKKIISDYLMEYVSSIRRSCEVQKWSINYMKTLFIGGTTSLIGAEVKQVFGEGAVLCRNPEYANVNGSLARLCGFKLGMNDLPKIDE